MCVVAEPRAVSFISNHQFEEEIGAASTESGLFIAKMEFSVRTRSVLRSPIGFSIFWGTFRPPGSAASSAIGLPLRVAEIIYKKKPTRNPLPGRPFALQYPFGNQA
jgi:hypothetical protein